MIIKKQNAIASKGSFIYILLLYTLFFYLMLWWVVGPCGRPLLMKGGGWANFACTFNLLFAIFQCILEIISCTSEWYHNGCTSKQWRTSRAWSPFQAHVAFSRRPFIDPLSYHLCPTATNLKQRQSAESPSAWPYFSFDECTYPATIDYVSQQPTSTWTLPNRTY